MNNWILPDINILSRSDNVDDNEQMEQAAREGDAITDRLDELGCRAEVEDIHIGPQVVSYDMALAEKVTVRDIPKWNKDLQYLLGTESLTIHAPMAGTKYIRIEIENKLRKKILIGDVIDSAQAPLTFPIGVAPDNSIIARDIKTFPHCLVAGMTGSGKSNMLQSMICSLLMKTTPDELSLLLVDTKQVELTMYDGIPNLLTPVITDAWEAVNHFSVLVDIMEKRYKLAQEYGARELTELNDRLPSDQKLPYILVVVDEIADLIYLSKHEIEEAVVRIAQKARAVGIHLVLATQTPRREIITGILKANLSSRIGFTTASELDSRIIIDRNGLGQLTGLGDAVFVHNGKIPQRIQSPFVSSAEIGAIVKHWSDQIYWRQELAA